MPREESPFDYVILSTGFHQKTRCSGRMWNPPPPVEPDVRVGFADGGAAPTPPGHPKHKPDNQ